MTRSHLFTSESVSEGHPDKAADQVSDRILDEFLAADPRARVACETLLADNRVVVAGEFRCRDEAVFRRITGEAGRIVRETLADIGYRDAAFDLDPWSCEVAVHFNRQAAEIAQGVDLGGGVIGAGDQGLMFGHACDETPELMPAAISLAHALVRRRSEARRAGTLPWLRPDAKSQVTVRYTGGRLAGVQTVVLSTQHEEGVPRETVREAVIAEIVDRVVPPELRAADFRVLVNPTGSFAVGGPRGDTGLTGRKIIVDTYGGACPHGGGAFSGKDPTKVDRSAAYMARHVAKNVVAAGLARRCTVQLAYAIGVAEPVSVYVDLHGTGRVDEEAVERAAREVFDLTPAGIIGQLDLLRPIYRRTAAGGHFGREDPDFTWERTDRAGALRDAVGG